MKRAKQRAPRPAGALGNGARVGPTVWISLAEVRRLGPFLSVPDANAWAVPEQRAMPVPRDHGKPRMANGLLLAALLGLTS